MTSSTGSNMSGSTKLVDDPQYREMVNMASHLASTLSEILALCGVDRMDNTLRWKPVMAKAEAALTEYAEMRDED